MRLNKDEILNALAERGNVAQFVAFRPDSMFSPAQSFCRMIGRVPNETFNSTKDALVALFECAPEQSVNVRSFLPDSPRSQEFIYGLRSVDDVLQVLNRLSSDGLHTIVNETVDVTDGGVSGVAQGDVIEFSPDDTPRCVEKPGVASLPFRMALDLLETVYGFRPDLAQSCARLEFSIHPRKRGTRGDHTLLWEYEENAPAAHGASMVWPNRFSRHIGDKAYGLLMAWLLGQKVPRTTVIGRRVAPFTFGQDTGSHESWTRTCPTEPEPGLFTTVRGWLDPFNLLASEDPIGTRIASVLGQQAVPAKFAGAALSGPEGLIIEGTMGDGDLFMLGRVRPTPLPNLVLEQISVLNSVLCNTLEAVRFEWVHDGTDPWIVQLHRGKTQSGGAAIVPGEASSWVTFEVGRGLEALRDLTNTIPANTGIELVGDVGFTSHIADVVRRSKIPTRIRPVI